jgi:hypothetical protein
MLRKRKFALPRRYFRFRLSVFLKFFDTFFLALWWRNYSLQRFTPEKYLTFSCNDVLLMPFPANAFILQIYAASGHYAALGLKTAVETALLAQLEEELANEELTAEDLSAALAVI